MRPSLYSMRKNALDDAFSVVESAATNDRLADLYVKHESFIGVNKTEPGFVTFVTQLLKTADWLLEGQPAPEEFPMLSSVEVEVIAQEGAQRLFDLMADVFQKRSDDGWWEPAGDCEEEHHYEDDDWRPSKNYPGKHDHLVVPDDDVEEDVKPQDVELDVNFEDEPEPQCLDCGSYDQGECDVNGDLKHRYTEV